MLDTHSYAAFDAKSPLRPFSFSRRDPGPHDVVLDILYCGICHSDLHMAKEEWGGSTFPPVPGHEIVGRVARVGAEVAQFKPRDTAGVGCFVGSCGRCAACKRGLEQYCEQGPVTTYGGIDEHGQRTQGG